MFSLFGFGLGFYFDFSHFGFGDFGFGFGDFHFSHFGFGDFGDFGDFDFGRTFNRYALIKIGLNAVSHIASTGLKKTCGFS